MFNHPKSSYLLSFSEMFERLSYYLGQTLILLFLISNASQGGLGWNKTYAAQVFGIYSCLMSLLPLVGGYVADRYLNIKRCISFGALMLSLGYFLMSIPSQLSFYSGLVTTVIGSAFFKPCMTSIFNDQYEGDEHKREKAFGLFFMAINVGAILSGFFGGSIQTIYGFRAVFLFAGICTFFSFVIFNMTKGITVIKHSELQDYGPLNFAERRKMIFLFVLCFFASIFFGAYSQYSGSLTLYVHDYTNRDFMGFKIPTSFFFIILPMLSVSGTPIANRLWNRFCDPNKSSTSIIRMAVGALFTSVAFLVMKISCTYVNLDYGIKSSALWPICGYMLLDLGNLCIYPILLSTIGRFAPAKYRSFMMAVAYASMGVGCYYAGYLTSLFDLIGPSGIFTIIFWILLGVCIALLVLLKPLSKLTSYEEKPKTPVAA